MRNKEAWPDCEKVISTSEDPSSKTYQNIPETKNLLANQAVHPLGQTATIPVDKKTEVRLLQISQLPRTLADD
jgi:hypothetical protein